MLSRRSLGLLVAALVLAASEPARAEVPYWFDLEGQIGARPVALRLNVHERKIMGSSNYAFRTGELALSGEVASAPPIEGRVSCRVLERGEGGRVTGELEGDCHFGVFAGTRVLSFEGTWLSANQRRTEPVTLVSRRLLELQALARYAPVLPVLAPPATIPPPAGCHGVPFIAGVARFRFRTFVLHASRFACRTPDGLDYQAYVVALSEVDDGAATPVLLRTLPLGHPQADFTDVVEFSCSMVPFRLAPDLLGLAITAGGTISGSGLIGSSEQHIVAFPSNADPEVLSSFEASSFGKSSIGNYDGGSAELWQLELDGSAPRELVIRTSAFAAIDGEDQASTEDVQAYRLRTKPLRLEAIPGRAPTLTALGRGRLIRGGRFLMEVTR